MSGVPVGSAALGRNDGRQRTPGRVMVECERRIVRDGDTASQITASKSGQDLS